MPSLKMTPFSGIWDSKLNDVSAVILPKTRAHPVRRLGNGSRTVKYK